MSRKPPEPEKPENHERWIVSYADMLTLLFALFVVLYATSDANPKKLQTVKYSIDQAFSVGVLQGSNGASPIFNTGGGLTPSWPMMPVGLKINTNVRTPKTRNSDQRE